MQNAEATDEGRARGLPRYIVRRLLMMIPVILGVTVIIFTLMYFTPGDPVRVILGPSASDAEILAMKERLGLSDPFFTRLVKYCYNAFFRFDLGLSYTTQRPVIDAIAARLPNTALLAMLSMVVALGVGIPTGIVSAMRQYSWFDSICMVVALIGVAMPNFWQGLMMILIFSVTLKWLPVSGFYGPLYWIMPALTVGTTTAAVITRMTRSSMLDVVRQNYIRTARAKGIPESKVITRHVLRNSLMPIITVIGLQFAGLLGGSILVETIFAIPGLGKMMVDSIKSRDFPTLMGTVLVAAVLFSVINLVVDIIYAFIDPKIRSEYGRKGR
jgi:peptide/nickel transport system permease protein